MKPPVLQTERLLLRPWTLEDVDALFEIVSDPLTMRFWERPFDRGQTRAWIERSLASYQGRGFGRWAVEQRVDDRGTVLVGDVGMLPLSVDGRDEVDLGYIIHHPYWRRGYAVEAAAAAVRHAIHDLGLPRLVANMAEDHTGSRRVAERLGMVLEKTFRNPRNRNLPTLVFALERGGRS